METLQHRLDISLLAAAEVVEDSCCWACDKKQLAEEASDELLHV